MLADIESRPVWKPMHLQPLYRAVECYGGTVSEDLFGRGICLPSSSSLTREEQDAVIREVRRKRLAYKTLPIGPGLNSSADQ